MAKRRFPEKEEKEEEEDTTKPKVKRRARGPTRDVIPTKGLACLAFAPDTPVAAAAATVKSELQSESPVGQCSASDPGASRTYGAPAPVRTQVHDDDIGAVVDYRVVPRITWAAVLPADPKPGEPKKPVRLGSYPERWDKACWWDTYEFQTKPVGCPISWDERKQEVHLEGVFCSWNCAMAYARYYINGAASGLVPSYIFRLLRYERQDQGQPTSDLKQAKAAPHWSLLERFGGFLSIDKFRELNCQNLRVHVWPQRMHMMHSGYDCFIECPYIPLPEDSEHHLRKVVRDEAMRNGHWNFPATTERQRAGGRLYFRPPPLIDAKRIRKTTAKEARKYTVQRARKQENHIVNVLGLKTKGGAGKSKALNKPSS